MKLQSLIDNVQFLPLGLFLVKSRAIIISDLHIGFEDMLSKSGVQLPRNSYPSMKATLEEYISLLDPKVIILNGDIKEYLSNLSFQESMELVDFIYFLRVKKLDVKFIRGNHDNFLFKFVEREEIDFYDDYLEIDNCFITHGHMNLIDEIANSPAEVVVLGHEHASIVVGSGGSNYKFKVIAEADLLDKKVLVLPAFSPIKAGCEFNVKDQTFLSPILKRADNFRYHLFEEDEWFTFEHKDIILK